MNRISSLALIVIGVVLIIWGTAASESISSGFSRLFTGAPTDKTVWLLIGGIAALITGLCGLPRGQK